jgi:hypothetical protein
MRDIYWKVAESKDGEPYRTIAEGTPIGSGAEGLPSELVEAFNRHLKEFEPTSGRWRYQIGNTKYVIDFSPTAQAPQGEAAKR